MTADPGRAAFLRELCGRQEDLLVWKHLDRSLEGRGDLDAAAPRRCLPGIVADARLLARDGLQASIMICCEHVADKQLLFFVRPKLLPQLFEFDVCTGPSRGLAPWADPHDMLDLAVLDDGIRRLRPGAEAIVSIVYHGLSALGNDRLRGDERDIVRRGLDRDLDGALAACRTLPPIEARASLVRLIRRVSEGSWSRRDAAAAWFGFAMTGPRHPGFTGRRIAFRWRIATGRDCVMGRLARRHDRQVSADGLADVLRVARLDGHEVVSL